MVTEVTDHRNTTVVVGRVGGGNLTFTAPLLANVMRPKQPQC